MPAMRIEPLDPAPLRDSARAHRRLRLDRLHEPERRRVPLGRRCATPVAMRARSPARKIACVGPPTADALLARGLAADVVPDAIRRRGGARGARRARATCAARACCTSPPRARATCCPTGSRRCGCRVDVVPRLPQRRATARAPAQLRDALAAGRVDAVTFASASAVRGFVDAVGAELARRAPAVSIGPVTSEAVRAAGIALGGRGDRGVDRRAGRCGGARSSAPSRARAAIVSDAPLRIGTRSSELALRQARLVQAALAERGRRERARDLQDRRRQAARRAAERDRREGTVHEGARGRSARRGRPISPCIR